MSLQQLTFAMGRSIAFLVTVLRNKVRAAAVERSMVSVIRWESGWWVLASSKELTIEVDGVLLL